ncbi:hypothetical protein HNQ60_003917 [Povalibacter uvarum]|uniref:WYL domain-containing protein n=1 Tax=Povalibacter uvarum TaxID=732238 RepID=A0A841HS50_9GAMM|nr:WYL domain-containing protein [Povalibacter uvarum]MBB6095030.1 hypothetical protein [Povalibacter uvarum]
MDQLADIPFAQQQRLRFIESSLLWEGEVQRQRVTEIFGVARNHISRDLKLYNRLYPGHLQYDLSTRSYRRGAKFKPALSSDDPEEYLSLLQTYAATHTVALIPALGKGPIPTGVLPQPSRTLDGHILRDVIGAIRRREGLKITYLSMSSDHPSTRTIWPHAFMNSGFDWIVRSYDDLRSEFRDFLLRRIDSVEPLQQASPMSATADAGWSELERVVVVPHCGLNPHQRSVTARDFGMRKDGKSFAWYADIRRCMLPYFFHHYRLDLDPAAPHAPRIQLRDRARLRQHFFKPLGE